jgi:hypothetical protein
VLEEHHIGTENGGGNIIPASWGEIVPTAAIGGSSICEASGPAWSHSGETAVCMGLAIPLRLLSK